MHRDVFGAPSKENDSSCRFDWFSIWLLWRCNSYWRSFCSVNPHKWLFEKWLKQLILIVTDYFRVVSLTLKDIKSKNYLLIFQKASTIYNILVQKMNLICSIFCLYISIWIVLWPHRFILDLQVGVSKFSRETETNMNLFSFCKILDRTEVSILGKNILIWKYEVL